MKDYNSKLGQWFNAIEAADTWRDPSERGAKKKGDLKPLAALFRSGVALPLRAQEVLADVLERHRLKSTTNRTPGYVKSDSQVNAKVLKEFADEFGRQPNWWRGPITKDEMVEAILVLQKREKATGRGHRDFEGKAAATILRQERLRTFAEYYNLSHKELKAAVSKKYGPINRMKKKPI